MAETERELHADFFMRWSQEANLAIEGMSEEQMTDWRNEMAKIALEAKVKTSVVDERLRQRRAERITNGRPWLIEGDVVEISKGIASRKERMSKEAKLLAMMKDLGVEGADEIVNNIAHKDNSSITSSSVRELKDTTNIQPSSQPKSTNTQESLLNDLSDSILQDINKRPIDDLIKAVNTAGHIANRLLGLETKDDSPFDFSKLRD